MSNLVSEAVGRVTGFLNGSNNNQRTSSSSSGLILRIPSISEWYRIVFGHNNSRDGGRSQSRSSRRRNRCRHNRHHHNRYSLSSAGLIPPPHSYLWRSQSVVTTPGNLPSDGTTPVSPSSDPTAPAFIPSPSGTTTTLSASNHDQPDGCIRNGFISCGSSPASFAYSVLGHSRRHHHRSSDDHESHDKNILAAVMSLMVIATLTTALTQPKWFSVKGGSCGRRYIGIQLFQNDAMGYPDMNYPQQPPPQPDFIKLAVPTDWNETEIETKIIEAVSRGRDPNDILTGILSNHSWHDVHQTASVAGHHEPQAGPVVSSCFSPDILFFQRIIGFLCLLAVLVNLSQFLWDTMGTSKPLMNALRLHAVGSIFGVILIIMIIGTCYAVATILEKDLMQKSSSGTVQFSAATAAAAASIPGGLVTPSFINRHVEIRFELSYYLVTLSGLLGLMAAAANLLKRPTQYLLTSADLGFYQPEFGTHQDSGVGDENNDDVLSTSHLWSPHHSSFRTVTLMPSSNINMSNPVPPPPPYSP